MSKNYGGKLGARRLEAQTLAAAAAHDAPRAARFATLTSSAYEQVGEFHRAAGFAQESALFHISCDEGDLAYQAVHRFLQLRSHLVTGQAPVGPRDDFFEVLLGYCTLRVAGVLTAGSTMGPRVMTCALPPKAGEWARLVGDATRWTAITRDALVGTANCEHFARLDAASAALRLAQSDPEGAAIDGRAALAFFSKSDVDTRYYGVVETVALAEIACGNAFDALEVIDAGLLRLAVGAAPLLRLQLLNLRATALTKTPMLDDAVTATEAAITFAKDLPGAAATYTRGSLCSTLSELYVKQRQVEKAIPLDLEALFIARALNAPHAQAIVLRELGVHCGMLTRSWGADIPPSVLNALREKVERTCFGGPNPSGPGRDLAVLARDLLCRSHDMLTERGDLKAAARAATNLTNFCGAKTHDENISAVARALRDLRANGGRPCDEITTLANLGLAYLKTGRHDAAWTCLKQSLNIAEATKNYEWAAHAATDLARICLEANDEDEAIRRYEQAISFIDNQRRRLPSTASARTAFARGDPRPYQPLVELYLARGKVAQAFGVVQKAKARALLELWDSKPSGTAAMTFSGEPASFAEIVADLTALEEPVILLDYFFLPDRLLIFAIRANASAPEVFWLDVTEAQVRRWCEDIEREVVRFQGTGPQTWTESAAGLISPIAHLLRPDDTILVAPHGALHGVPLHAVPINGAPLIAAYAIAYLPSASVLGLMRRAWRPPRALKSCCAIGVDFEAEAEHVAGMFDQSELLRGPLSVERLRAVCTGYDVYHFSCHGHFDPLDSRKSGLVLCPPGLDTEGASGLATIEDLLGIDFRSQLVCLSACSSGGARIQRGDEQIGLVRAFLLAGAPRVISTLWPVAAVSAEAFFEHFYSALNGARGDGALSTARALRKAISDVRAHPGFESSYYWAPFILSGHPA